MGLKKRLEFLFALLAVLATASLVRDLLGARAIAAYDRAVTAENYEAAAAYPGDAGRFAAAHAAQRAGRHQEARQLYARLEQGADPALRVAALYNAGNTYLEEAIGLDLEREADRAVPLLELAKRSYRDALRLDPDTWDARYNLERALALLPDAVEKQVIEVEGRQSPVRTVIGGEADAPWP